MNKLQSNFLAIAQGIRLIFYPHVDVVIHDLKEKHKLLFKDDWQEKINLYVTEYLKKEGLALKALTKEKKRELVHALYQEGAFQAKNAAAYIANIL